MSTLWFPWEHHHFWQIYDFAGFWWNCTETTKLSQKSKCWFQTCTNSAEPHQKTWCVSNYEAEPWVCWEICSIVARNLFFAILERVLCFLVRSSKNIWTLGAVSWFRYFWNDKIATVYDVALISQWPEQKHCHVILVRDVFVIFGMEVLSFRITSFCVAREHWFFRDTSTISLPVVEHVAKAWSWQEEPMYFHKMFTKYLCLPKNPNTFFCNTSPGSVWRGVPQLPTHYVFGPFGRAPCLWHISEPVDFAESSVM